MAFTGQVLRFDQDAYWGLGIGASISSRMPIVGPVLVKLLLGGPIIAGATLSRFFALHVFVIPGLLIAFIGLHVLMVLKLGINEWPMPGRLVRRSDYMEKYHEMTHTQGVPFVPYGVWKDAAVFRRDSSGHRRLRVLLRSVRPKRTTGPACDPNGAAARLFLPVALCRFVTASAAAGNPGAVDWTGDRAGGLDRAAVCFGRRREELEAASDRGTDDPAGRRCARHVHEYGGSCALESGDGRVDGRGDSQRNS